MIPTTDARNVMRVIFDSHHCTLTDAETEKMREGIDSLARKVENFPLSDVRILVERNERSNDFSVKVTLILDGATLVTNDHDTAMHAAFERCLDALTENIQAYKARLSQVPERQKQQKGTHQDLEPTVNPDPEVLENAHLTGDYGAFRMALVGYEEPIRKRMGRWVERYPDMNAQIGKGLEIADLVEEVYLTAFEEYGHRPPGIRLGEWLDSLIDPAIRNVQARPDEELENISLARSAVEAEQGRGAV